MRGRAARSLLTLDEMSPAGVARVLSDAAALKSGRRRAGRALAGRSLAMIFEKPSTRTRVSFEVGMHQLGGHAVHLDAGGTQISRGESAADTARTLSRYADCIMARAADHSWIEELAAAASVPVINGLSGSFHPCQALADLMTIRERRGRLRGLRVAWIGDGNNVCHSLMIGCAKTGMSMSVASPEGYGPDPAVVRRARESAEVELTRDPARAAAGADVVATDTFYSMHARDRARRRRALYPRYRVGPAAMAAAGPRAVFLHCLPADRASEVAPEVIDGPQSAVWDEAENRLHAQKALLLRLAGGRGV